MLAHQGPSPTDVAAFERGLQVAGAHRLQEQGDPTLTDLLRQVDARRRRRLAGSRVTASRARGVAESAGGIAGPHGDVARAAGPPGTVLAIEEVGPTVRIFRVGAPAGFRFRAGQYVKVGYGSGKRRSFSLASAPHEAHLELCIALNPGGRLTPELFALRVGARLDIDPAARGSFALDSGARRHLMVATGTGIAPLRSMLRDALHRGFAGEFVILHGASRADGLPYREELGALAAADARVRYEPSISGPGGAAAAGGLRTGRLDGLVAEAIAALHPRDTHTYVCGNPGMVSSVGTQLLAAGFPVARETFD